MEPGFFLRHSHKLFLVICENIQSYNKHFTINPFLIDGKDLDDLELTIIYLDEHQDLCSLKIHMCSLSSFL